MRYHDLQLMVACLPNRKEKYQGKLKSVLPSLAQYGCQF